MFQIVAGFLTYTEYISQGSVATRLRCGQIFNDNFITGLLLSPLIKNFWKSVNTCRSYGMGNSRVLFFHARDIAMPNCTYAYSRKTFCTKCCRSAILQLLSLTGAITVSVLSIKCTVVLTCCISSGYFVTVASF